MLSNSSQIVTYTMLWSPIGYMVDAINHDYRGTGGKDMCLLGIEKEHREAESIPVSYTHLRAHET